MRRMKKQSLSIASIFSLAVAFLLPLNMNSAHAASTASIRWDSAGSSGFAWSLENLAADNPNNAANFQVYYTPAVKLYDVIAANGATVNLRWLVADANGKPMVNTPVTLALNPAYTYPIAHLSSPVLDPTKNMDGSGRDPVKTDNADIPLVTDANGYVTYSITNNTPNADAEDLIPHDGVSVPPSGSGMYTQLQLYVGTFANTVDGYKSRNAIQTSQDIDIVEIHWEAGAVPGPVVAQSSSSTATGAPPANIIRWDQKNTTNVSWTIVNKLALASILQGNYFTPQVNFYDLFMLYGTKTKIAWHITDPKGKPLANTPVTLILNPAYSNGSANVSDQSSKTVPLAHNSNQDGADISLITDANGDVSYTLQNNDTSATAEPAPFDKQSPPVDSANISTQLLLYTGTYANYAARTPSWSVQKIQDVDILEIHWVSGLPVATTGAASSNAGGVAPSGGIQPTGPVDTTESGDAPIGQGSGVAPKNLTAPSLSKPAKVGSTILASIGKWDLGGNASASIAWYSCKTMGSSSDKLPAKCAIISGITGTRLSITSKFRGQAVRVAITETNQSGSTTKFSASTGIIK
jgi:hypothetical protein